MCPGFGKYHTTGNELGRTGDETKNEYIEKGFKDFLQVPYINIYLHIFNVSFTVN